MLQYVNWTNTHEMLWSPPTPHPHPQFGLIWKSSVIFSFYLCSWCLIFGMKSTWVLKAYCSLQPRAHSKKCICYWYHHQNQQRSLSFRWSSLWSVCVLCSLPAEHLWESPECQLWEDNPDDPLTAQSSTHYTTLWMTSSLFCFSFCWNMCT